MHTLFLLHLLLVLLTPTTLATSFSTSSDYGAPWYNESPYSLWRRRRALTLPCSFDEVKLGEACLQDGKLQQKQLPPIQWPTPGPQPYRGERIPEDWRFFKLLSKSGEGLGYWVMWSHKRDSVQVLEGVGDEGGEGQDEKHLSGGVEKEAVDTREEVGKKQARDTIYHHFNTYFGQHVHKPVGTGPMEKAIGEEAKWMEDGEVKAVDYEETKRIQEAYVREKEAERSAQEKDLPVDSSQTTDEAEK